MTVIIDYSPFQIYLYRNSVAVDIPGSGPTRCRKEKYERKKSALIVVNNYRHDTARYAARKTLSLKKIYGNSSVIYSATLCMLTGNSLSL